MPAEGSSIELTADYCSGLVPRRDPTGHKFTFGVLMCLCGSLDYAGAALMCGLAAVRGGAGMVALAVPRSIQPIVAGRVPETITVGLPETAGGIIDPSSSVEAIIARDPAALVIGPGLQESDEYARLIGELLRAGSRPAVVDAAALNMLAVDPAWFSDVRPGTCVLTPHAGEFARLTGEEVSTEDAERVVRGAAAAERFGQVVVLKGAKTVVAAPRGRVAISPFANAALATAGSGDVLAGLIGALLCQGVAPFDAACLGVYLHGRAGERLSERFGDAGLAATDLPYEIALSRHELVTHST